MASWWQAAAGLNPVHAWDADGFFAGAFADRVGANTLSGGVGERAGGGYRGISGNSNLMQLGTAISTAPDGVFVLFGQFVDEFISFYRAAGNTVEYAVFAAGDGNFWMRNGGAEFKIAPWPEGSLSRTPIFCALTLDGGNARIYANGAWAGGVFDKATRVQSQVAGIGWNTAGSKYNISGDELFMAAGYWQGKATLEDLQALEAACRAALEAPPFAARYAADTHVFVPLHPFWNRPQMGFDTVAKDPMQPIHRSHKGRVVGTLFAKGEPSNTPMKRKLGCFDEATRTLLAECLSDAAGNYVFTGLDPTRRVFVVAFDDQDHYRAVVADKLLPQLEV